MGYLVAADRVPSAIAKKCFKRLRLFFEISPAGREYLSSTMTDHGGYSAIFSIGEKTDRIETIGSLAALSCRCCARSRHQFPSAHKFVLCVSRYTRFHPDSPLTPATVLNKGI